MKRILLVVAIAACSKSAKPATAPSSTLPTETANQPPGEAAPAKPESAEPAAPAPPPEPAKPEPPAPKRAAAEMAPASKSKVKGTASFVETDGGVEVTVNLEGLKPGEHGWHVHEKGDCSAPDAKSAGEHFNPEKHKHGAPDAPEHHAGDFGNLTAGKDGKASTTFTMKGVTLGEGETSLIDRALIIHEKKDDLKTQPSGNAGARVSCGVIKPA